MANRNTKNHNDVETKVKWIGSSFIIFGVGEIIGAVFGPLQNTVINGTDLSILIWIMFLGITIPTCIATIILGCDIRMLKLTPEEINNDKIKVIVVVSILNIVAGASQIFVSFIFGIYIWVCMGIFNDWYHENYDTDDSERKHDKTSRTLDEPITVTDDQVETLKNLKKLKDAGIITEEEFESKRRKILKL